MQPIDTEGNHETCLLPLEDLADDPSQLANGERFLYESIATALQDLRGLTFNGITT